jgi:hypothetical protein
MPRFPAAFRPPAFASQVIRPPQGIGPPSRSAYRPRHRTRTPTGFPRSTRMRYDRVGCLLYPGGGGAHPADKKSPAGACRFPAASPSTPPTASHRARFTHNETSNRGSLTFTRPVCPLPVTPGWKGVLRLPLELRTPPLTSDARQGRGQAIEHKPGATRPA